MGPSCAPVTRCHRFSVVSISLQEAAKGLQEVEEIPDFFSARGWEDGEKIWDVARNWELMGLKWNIQ